MLMFATDILWLWADSEPKPYLQWLHEGRLCILLFARTVAQSASFFQEQALYYCTMPIRAIRPLVLTVLSR